MATKSTQGTKTKKPVARKAAPKASAKRPSPAEEAKPVEEVQVNPKLADPHEILAMYDRLIDELAKTEARQRIAKKPHRIYFVHRKKIEVMRMNFKKSIR